MFPLRVYDEIMSRTGGMDSQNTVGFGTQTKKVQYDSTFSHVVEKANGSPLQGYIHKTTCKYDSNLIWTRKVETSVYGDAKQDFIERLTGAVIFSIKLARPIIQPDSTQNCEESADLNLAANIE